MWNQLLGLLGGTKLLGFTGFFFYTVNPFSLPFRRFGDDRQSYRVLLGFLFFIHFIDLGRYILLGFYWVFFVFFFKYFQTFFIAFVETSTKLPGCTGFFFWFGLETVSIGFIGRFGTIDIVTEFYRVLPSFTEFSVLLQNDLVQKRKVCPEVTETQANEIQDDN